LASKQSEQRLIHAFLVEMSIGTRKMREVTGKKKKVSTWDWHSICIDKLCTLNYCLTITSKCMHGVDKQPNVSKFSNGRRKHS